MSVQAGVLTFEEFLKLPNPQEGRLELHHGEVILMPPRTRVHVEIQQRLLELFLPLAKGKGFLTNEFPFRPTAEHEAWQADLGFVTKERWDKDESDYFLGAPDLVVEVLSRSNTVDEINDKMTVSMENGCVSFWVVDPKRKTVSVTEGDVTKRYSLSMSIPCGVLNGVIEVRAIFE